MTGMGDDGADGMRAVQAAGGVTIAQSMDTCVVDSMPRAAIEAGSASRVVPLDALPSVLTNFEFERPLSDPFRHIGSRNPSGSTTMNRMGGGENHHGI